MFLPILSNTGSFPLELSPEPLIASATHPVYANTVTEYPPSDVCPCTLQLLHPSSQSPQPDALEHGALVQL
jgi:hypothetical protein